MLGPMGAQIISLLKLVTPAEIDRYVRKSKSRPVKALAAGAEDFDLANSEPSPYKQSRAGPSESNEDARILRLAPLARDDLTDDEPDALKSQSFSAHVRDRASPEKGQESAPESPSVFLLEQRRRLKR